MFLWWMMRIPVMLLGLMAFDTKCAITAFQPRPQRTACMTTLRFQHSSDDLPVRVAVLEDRMDAMTKTLERIESKIDTTVDELDTKIDRKIERIESKIDTKNEKIDSLLLLLVAGVTALYTLHGLQIVPLGVCFISLIRSMGSSTK
jgi:tetrahydromethanopterin S-methyltransferase subunit G